MKPGCSQASINFKEIHTCTLCYKAVYLQIPRVIPQHQWPPTKFVAWYQSNYLERIRMWSSRPLSPNVSEKAISLSSSIWVWEDEFLSSSLLASETKEPHGGKQKGDQQKVLQQRNRHWRTQRVFLCCSRWFSTSLHLLLSEIRFFYTSPRHHIRSPARSLQPPKTTQRTAMNWHVWAHTLHSDLCVHLSPEIFPVLCPTRQEW